MQGSEGASLERADDTALPYSYQDGSTLLLRAVSLGGKATVLMQAFDRLRLLTPGGGGYGDAAAGDVAPQQQQHGVSAPQRVAAGSLAAYSEAQLTV